MNLNERQPDVNGRNVGKWVVYALDDFLGRRTGSFHIVCSECGFNKTIWHKDIFPKFCENCGAEMKEESDG